MCNLNYPPQKVLLPSKISSNDKLLAADKERARNILQSCYTPALGLTAIKIPKIPT